jgi:hypothetical protein
MRSQPSLDSRNGLSMPLASNIGRDLEEDLDQETKTFLSCNAPIYHLSL